MKIPINDLTNYELQSIRHYIANNLSTPVPDDPDSGVAVTAADIHGGQGRARVHREAWLPTEALTPVTIDAELARRRDPSSVPQAPPPLVTATELPPTRPTWDQLFLELARTIARRTTCTRALEAYGGIGAVLVESDSRHILGMGYTGSLPGQAHCTDVGCLLVEGTPGCQRTLHAEQNAIIKARASERPKTLYCNVSPCMACLKIAVAVGVRRVVFAQLCRLHAEQVALCEAAAVAWEHAGP